MQREFQSIWDALEEDAVIAANLKLRSMLMIEISEYLRNSGLTQKEAAKKLGTTQRRLNDVLTGRTGQCTLDRLINMLASVGYKVDFKVYLAA